MRNELRDGFHNAEERLFAENERAISEEAVMRSIWIDVYQCSNASNRLVWQSMLSTDSTLSPPAGAKSSKMTFILPFMVSGCGTAAHLLIS